MIQMLCFRAIVSAIQQQAGSAHIGSGLSSMCFGLLTRTSYTAQQVQRMVHKETIKTQFAAQVIQCLLMAAVKPRTIQQLYFIRLKEKIRDKRQQKELVLSVLPCSSNSAQLHLCYKQIFLNHASKSRFMARDVFHSVSLIRKKGKKKPFICQMASGYSRAWSLTNSIGYNLRKKNSK